MPPPFASYRPALQKASPATLADAERCGNRHVRLVSSERFGIQRSRESGCMSTGPYPEVNMDETKPDPPKEAPKDTPKQELPRENSPQTAPGTGPDPQTLSSFERAAMEMAERARKPPEAAQTQNKPAAQTKPERKAETAARVEPPKPAGPAAAITLVDQFDLTALPFTATPFAAAPAAPAPAAPAASAIRPMFDDTFRLTLTAWQSAVAAVAICLFVLGAFGMAAYSWVVAHDWSCRVGLVEKYCPPVPQPKPLPQPEIPS